MEGSRGGMRKRFGGASGRARERGGRGGRDRQTDRDGEEKWGREKG